MKEGGDLAATKDVKELREAVRQAGYRTVYQGGHWHVKNDAGKTLDTIPSTPSDRRWWENTVSRLRRKGILAVDPKKEGQMASVTTARPLTDRQARVIARLNETMRELGYPNERGVIPEFARHVMGIRIPRGARTFANQSSAEECVRRNLKGDGPPPGAWAMDVLEWALDDLDPETWRKTWEARTRTTSRNGTETASETTSETTETEYTTSAAETTPTTTVAKTTPTSPTGRYKGLSPLDLQRLQDMHDEMAKGLVRHDANRDHPYGIWTTMAQYIIDYNTSIGKPVPTKQGHDDVDTRRIFAARVMDAYNGKTLRSGVKQYIERATSAWASGWTPPKKTETPTPTAVMEPPTWRTEAQDETWPTAAEFEEMYRDRQGYVDADTTKAPTTMPVSTTETPVSLRAMYWMSRGSTDSQDVSTIVQIAAEIYRMEQNQR
jgi:hypothetical protein